MKSWIYWSVRNAIFWLLCCSLMGMQGGLRIEGFIFGLDGIMSKPSVNGNISCLIMPIGDSAI